MAADLLKRCNFDHVWTFWVGFQTPLTTWKPFPNRGSRPSSRAGYTVQGVRGEPSGRAVDLFWRKRDGFQTPASRQRSDA